MKVLVTGAGGFLGRAVVDAVTAMGHDVVAMVRGGSKTVQPERPGVTWLRGDLRQRGSWTNAIGDVDGVVHLAAAVSGDIPTQFAGTVLATETLLDALPLAALKRFVHISSFSVYDFTKARGGVLDEETPLEADPDARDAYTITKMWQEKLVVDRCSTANVPYVVIRPGAIYGPGKTWNFGRAMTVGRTGIVFAPWSRMRLTHVENCADAIARALTADAAVGQVLNIVDDDVPSFGRYLKLSKAAGAPIGAGVPLPWWSVAAIGHGVRGVNALFFKGNAKLPEFLALHRQKAQWKNLRYSNAKAKRLLGWTPKISITEGVAQMVEAEKRAASG